MRCILKSGISCWSFPGALRGLSDYVPAARQAKAAGLSGLEIALSPEGCLTPKSDDRQAAAVAASVRAEGVEIVSLASCMLWDYPLTHPDATIRNQGRETLRRMIATAHAIGTDAVLVIPGAVDIFFNPAAPVVDYRDAWSRSQEAIASCIPEAQAAGVRLGLENVWNRFLLSPLEMARFVDQFESKSVGCYFDVGNCLLLGYPDQWIRALGERICRVHFKDFRRATGTADGFVDLLAGDVDWPAVVAALREIRYDGFCTVEMIPPYTHHPEVLIENAGRAMKAILG